MLGISAYIAEHSLNVMKGMGTVKQSLCQSDEERCKAIEEELARLLAVGFIHGEEVHVVHVH